VGLSVTVTNNCNVGTTGSTSVPIVPLAPSSVDAHAVAATTIHVSWAGGTGSSYRVLRAATKSADQAGSWTIVADGVTGSSFDDSGVAASAAYLYRVQSIGNGLLSAPSAFDIAAAIVFTTDPDLIIRAVDWTDMRKGVRALCIAAQINMSQCTFTDALSDEVTQAPLTEIRKVHLMDLRSALNASRLALGLGAAGFAEPDPSDVKLSQVDEIRGGVR